MKHESMDAKQRLLDTMVQLLMEKKDVNKITTRQIAALANVNSALINYYYQSKENLVYKAVEICMENIAKMLFDEELQDQIPTVRLKSMVRAFSTFCFDNYYLSEIAISNELKNGSINTSGMIVPLLKEIFQETKTEIELKLIALQIIVPLQVIFLNRDVYKIYLSKDMQDVKTRNELLDQIIDNVLKMD